MNKLLEIIDSRVLSKIRTANFLTAVPCTVLAVNNDGTVKVKVIANDSTMTVPNYSGSSVSEGESVQMFYSGSVLAEKTAYIGASANKDSGGRLVRLTGTTLNKVMGSTESVFGNIGVKCNGEANVMLFLNTNVYGTEAGNLAIKIYVDNVALTFSPQQYISSDKYSFISLSTALSLTSGEHTINVTGAGKGSVTSAEIYIVGTNIEMYEPYVPTGDDDYLYATSNNEVHIRHYIGEANNPSVPDTINDNPVKYIEPTAFNYSTVNRVYIPDGVEEIG